MGLDMAKYRRIFLEESTDHLAEISRALLDLEKEMTSVDAIDTLFRMAHSIKSMAASLGYDSVADLSHRMEDRMEGVRSAGRVRNPEELGLLFRALEALESMVQAIADEREPEAVDPALLDQLEADPVSADSKDSASDDPPSTNGPPTEVHSDDVASASQAGDEAPDAVGGEPKKV